MEHHVPALVRTKSVHAKHAFHVPSQDTIVVPSAPAPKRRKIEKAEPKGDFVTPKIEKAKPKVDLAVFNYSKLVDTKSWKIGYQRYLYTLQRPDGVPVICLGEEVTHPGVDASPKNIDLTISQFKVLYGLMLSGKAQGERFQPKDGSDRLSPNYNLGDGVRFVWSRFAKANVATVRRFITKANGDLVPMAKGFSFTDKYYTALLNILKTLEPLKAVAAMDVKEPNVHFHAKRLLDALIRTMYHYVYIERTTKCPTCITYMTEQGGELQENRKQPGHTCVFKHGTPTGNGPVTDEEWDMAVTSLAKNQVAEAYMLTYNQGTFKDIAAFLYAPYLDAHRVEMIEKMNEYFKEFLVFDHNIFNYRNGETSVDYQKS